MRSRASAAGSSEKRVRSFIVAGKGSSVVGWWLRWEKAEDEAIARDDHNDHWQPEEFEVGRCLIGTSS